MDFLVEHAATILWVAVIMLEALLVSLAVKRKLSSVLPYFVAFVAVSGFRDVALFAVHRLTAPHYMPYFVTYWTTDVLVVVLRFLVLLEIVRDVTERYEGLFRSTMRAFRWTASVLAAVAIISAILAPGSGPDRLISGIEVFQRCVVLFEAGMLLTLLALTSYFGMRWRRVTFGVALGFALHAALQLPAFTLAARLGDAVTQSIAVMSAAAYISALGVWIAFCCGAEQECQPALPIPNSLHNVLRTHNSVLELLQR